MDRPSEKLPPPPAIVIVVLGLLLAAIGGLHAYLARRLFVDPALPPFVQTLGWATLALLLLCLPAGVVLRRKGPARWARRIQPVGYFWLGAFTITALVTVAVDLATWAILAWGGPWLAEEALLVARIEAATITACSILLVGYAHRVAMSAPRVTRVEVSLPGLSSALEGLRIVQISDLHLGEGLGREFLEKVLEQVRSLKPDIVAITGDLVEGYVEELAHDVWPLRDLSAPLGVYFVTGNHEYFWDGRAWEAAMRRLGITVLHNEHRVLDVRGARLVLGGVTDVVGGQFFPDHASSVAAAFANAPGACPRILLAHQPLSLREAIDAGVALQLSGHTHGGQLPPMNFLARLQQPAIRGLKQVRGTWIYTHQGTGFWGPPLRLGSSPEIAEIILRPAVA
jgi:hypothetical protein